MKKLALLAQNLQALQNEGSASLTEKDPEDDRQKAVTADGSLKKAP